MSRASRGILGSSRLLLAVLSAALLASPAAALDTDGDGIQDFTDNCTLVPNPGQTDTDLDGFGNICDCDYDGDMVCQISDLGLWLQWFGKTTPPAPYELDQDSDFVVQISDYELLMGPAFGNPPGPSGLSCAGVFHPCVGEVPMEHTELSSGGTLVETIGNFTDLRPVSSDVTFALTDAEFGGVDVFLNGQLLDESAYSFTATSVTLPSILAQGRNHIEISAWDSHGYILNSTCSIWAGSLTATIEVRDEGGTLTDADLEVRVLDAAAPEIGPNPTTVNGQATVTNLPETMIAVIARAANGDLGTTAFHPANQAGPVVVTVEGVDPPSPIDNNDFSQGLDGWDIPAGTPVILHE